MEDNQTVVENNEFQGQKTEDSALIDSEIASQKYEEAKKSNDPKKKKKSAVWNFIFLGINIVFMFFIIKGLLADASGLSLKSTIALQGKKLYYLLGGVVCILGVYLCSTLSLSVLVKNTTGKHRFWLCLNTAVMGKYYDYITPMAVGGQPFQILSFVKGGIAPGVATSIPIIKMIIQQLVRWFLVVVLFIFVVPLIPIESGLVNLLVILLKILGVVGIIITSFVSISFVFLGSSKLIGRTIARWTIKIGYKLRIVKNYRKSYDKFMRQVLEYQSSMAYLAKNKAVLIKEVLLATIEFVLYCSIGFFACMAFSATIDATSFAVIISLWAISLARYQVVDMASTIMILPGGTGIKEIAFLVMYNFFFKNSGTVAWGLLSWRFFDYYIFLIVGFVILIIKMILSLKKDKKNKKSAS